MKVTHLSIYTSLLAILCTKNSNIFSVRRPLAHTKYFNLQKQYRLQQKYTYMHLSFIFLNSRKTQHKHIWGTELISTEFTTFNLPTFLGMQVCTIFV